MQLEKSCGGIIFRKSKNNIEFLIIKNKGARHWDFPKGHVEAGETEEETARREIKEEVGLEVEFIKGFRESMNYIIKARKVDKTVVYFLCKTNSSKVKYIFDEVSDHAWLKYENAVKKLTFQNAIGLLKKANIFLKKLKV